MAEISSPLAAMQQPSLTGHFGFNPHSSYQFGHLSSAGHSPSFAFSKLQPLAISSSDYFTTKPQRSTSPTTSLAADLSQNFHIDKTWVKPSGTVSPRPFSLLILVSGHKLRLPGKPCSPLVILAISNVLGVCLI